MAWVRFWRLPNLIVLEPCGGLGNRLQTSAYSLAYAVEKGFKISLLCLEGFDECFKGTSRNLGCLFPVSRFHIPGRGLLRQVLRSFVAKSTYLVCKCVPLVGQFLKIQILEGSKAFPLVLDSPEIHGQIRSHRLTIVMGYYIYCSPKLLVKHNKQIIEFFEPCNGGYAKGKNAVMSLRKNFDSIIGVHIRHGDYQDYLSGEHFFAFDEYRQWMTSLCENEEGQSLHFIVCSDADLSQCDFDRISWQSGPGDFIEDMYLLAACDYVMGPFSTFNRWSAFYGGVPRLELKRHLLSVSLRDFSPVKDLTYMAPVTRS
jgi:hypothetical protein